MDKTNHKKLKLPIRKILSNNLFMLRMIHRTSPGMLSTFILINIIDASAQFISNTFMLRYAINGIGEGKSFIQIASMLLLWLAIRLAVSGVVSVYYQCFYNVKMTDVKRDIHNAVYKHAAKVELACYENPTYYDAFAKAIDECDSRADAVIDSISSLIYRVIGFSANFVLVIFIDPILLFFVLIPLLVIPMQLKINKIRYKRKMALTIENRQRDYSRRTFYLADYAKEMRLSDMPLLMLERFKESGLRTIDIIAKNGWSLATLGYLITECNEMLTALGTMMYAAWQTFGTGKIGYGDCIIIVNSIDTISYTLSNSANTLLRFQENALYIENLIQFLEHEPGLVGGDAPLPDGGDIVFENVSFRYDGAQTDALHDISMRFGRNEKIAIVGHNGAGKTTLVKLLLRLYDADGQITYGNTDIKTLPLDAYRDMFAAVMQDFHVFALSVADNVILGKRTAGDTEIVVDALKKSGFYKKAVAFPNGIDTMMTKEFDKAGVQLSGGEQQKLAIAHVYSKQNRFVILDEPSSALDPIAEYEMYNRMMAACEDCGMIFISHRLSSAVLADRIYLMENGGVIESGTHAELMAKDGRYAEMFKKQAMNYVEV